MPRDYNGPAQRAILQSMPGTIDEIAAKSGYARCTVERQLRKLRADDKSHVIDWRRPNGSGNFIAVHSAGPGVDVPCDLKPLTCSQDWAKRKEKYGMDLLRQKERARHWARRARLGKTIDPLMIWIPRKK